MNRNSYDLRVYDYNFAVSLPIKAIHKIYTKNFILQLYENDLYP